MKRISLAAVLILGLALVAGCGGAAKDMSVAEVSSRLLSEISYQDELNSNDLDTAGMFLNLEGIDITDAAVFETSGATAEEVVVMECATDADAEKAEAMLKQRVEEQKQNYADYVPEELTKLNAAVIVRSGKFAVLSVSDDPDTAKKILSEYK
ncbi:MAG: DUF4358 domain-containing protein [Lachnospiraceae bacterium]|nr:DUF4358 domain-containing protein [Lachnospiraceae bacterium]